LTEKKAKKKTSKFATARHKFLYRWEDANGKQHVIEAWARVRHPSHGVTLTIKPEHVQESIKRHGAGDTANCAMAVCATKHAESFPHAVEGHIDWTYTRAFVVNKLRRDGLPAECYVYDHYDNIAKLNDSLNGQKKLLKKLRAEGPLEIKLIPKRIRSKPGRPGTAVGRKPTGARSTEKRLRGGKLRYAVAKLASDKAA
jgi:hypothetical protein